MNERSIRAPLDVRDRLVPGSVDGRERRRGVKVDLLLGGFHIPGFIEYHARDGQVTFIRDYVRRIDCENGQERYTLCYDTTG